MHSRLVLDAGAFYAGTSFQSSDPQLYTTHSVYREVRHIKSQFSALEALRDCGRLAIQDPTQENVGEVLEAAKKTGDSIVLSVADVSIIALALELGALLVTDDQSASNVASSLGIPVRPATSGKEIQEVRKWIYYCSACGKTFRAEQKECLLCGNELKRKYKKVRAV